MTDSEAVGYMHQSVPSAVTKIWQHNETFFVGIELDGSRVIRFFREDGSLWQDMDLEAFKLALKTAEENPIELY